MSQIEHEQPTITNKRELPASLKDLPYKVAQMKAKVYRALGFATVAALMLTSCVPEGQAQETRPAATQTIEGLDVPGESEEAIIETITATSTPEATATPKNTPTSTATATPENTPTVTATATPETTATPEEMTQAEIRAEILAAGVNLDDLANSADEWTRSHKAIETIQNYIDNLNFGREEAGSITTVVIGLEAVENLTELDQAPLTDGGWKLTTFAKLAYKDVNGDWQIIKVPLSAYNVEEEVLWEKYASTIQGQIILDKEKAEQELGIIDRNPEGMARLWTLSNIMRDYHSGTGSFIKIFTGSSLNPRYANNDCICTITHLFQHGKPNA